MWSRTNKKETKRPDKAVEVAKEAEATTLAVETEEAEEAVAVVAGAGVVVVVERPWKGKMKWQQTARQHKNDDKKEGQARHECLRMQQDIQRQRNQAPCRMSSRTRSEMSNKTPPADMLCNQNMTKLKFTP